MTTTTGDRHDGELAGRYVLERELGRGGMAVVYLARDLKLNRLVALKLLRQELRAALGPDRFLREIAIVSRLSHPHILPLNDSGEDEGRLFYVMPLVDGESLRDRLARELQLPVTEVVRILRAVAGALDCAHTAGVIHRDIKPENILLARDPLRWPWSASCPTRRAAGTPWVGSRGSTVSSAWPGRPISHPTSTSGCPPLRIRPGRAGRSLPGRLRAGGGR